MNSLFQHLLQFWRWLLSLLRRGRYEREMEEEMRFHLEMQIEQNLSSGMAAEEAHYAARRQFGNQTWLKEVSREMWSLNSIETLILDLRYAARTLARSPGFAAIVVLTLGLGIGATTTIFNVVNGVLLRQLPFREPDRLVALHEKWKGMERGMPFSPPDYIVLTQQQDWFASVGAFRNTQFEISGSGAPERVTGARVTASLFETLGVDPIVGRTFTDVEDNEGREVALLSYAYWNRKFGQDASIIGRGIQVDRRLYTIIGVLPPSLVFPSRGMPSNGKPADVFVPMSFTAGQKQAYGAQYNHSVVARLKPGVAIEQVRAATPLLARRFEERYPAFFQRIPGFSLELTATQLRNEIVGAVQTLLLLLLAAALMVLLIGCANVANLMLARATGRAREMAIRVALGAGRFRLIRQVLVESSVLALTGGALGVFLASMATDALMAASPIQLPRSEAIVMNQRALLFAAAVSVLTALVFGLVPAIESSRSEAADALREGGPGRTTGQRRRRWLKSFVAIQTALAVALTIGAGLLMRSFTKLQEVNPGFRPQQVLGLSLNLPLQSYPEAAQVTGFWERLRERLSTIPGVEAVGIGDLPLAVREGRAIWPEDRSAFERNPPGIRQAWVYGEYFRALGAPLLKGRWFTDQDNKDSERVIILNETMARIFYPGKNAIGQRLKWGGSAESRSPWMTVIGVVGDIKQESLQEVTAPMTFTPLMQESDGEIAHPNGMLRAMNVVIRTSGDPSAIASAVYNRVAEIDPALPVADLKTMEDAVRQAAAPQRFNTYLFGAFAAIALLLATMGIAGVVAYSVGQRTREIGLRIALGASRGKILLLMLREGLMYAGLGVVAGVGMALGLTQLMSSLLYGVQATDTVTFGAVIGIVGMVAAAASFLPAYRATRVDPMVALRND
jgi:predicted permease